MKLLTPRRLRLLASIVGVLLLSAVALGLWFYGKLRSSLPQLDGAASLPGLTAPVTVARDALGVPTLRGASRNDVACALGYLHAQDRFFQMDLLRRHAAGELAEILGQAALPIDRAVRVYGFRPLAQTVLARLAPDERAFVEAYTIGVNAGLAALGTKPFEYYALRLPPQPWRPEDSVLVIYAMTLELQDAGGYERSLTALRDKRGNAAVAFFAPLALPDDAALDGSTAPFPSLPGPQLIDLRTSESAPPSRAQLSAGPFISPGSNSFALAGARTTTGAALLANDMHLALRVPNIWYRASLEWGEHKVTGVTLPGAPNLVVGSNGHIAWGFTNSYVDTADLVTVQPAPIGLENYLTYNGKQAAWEKRREKILVRGGEPVELETLWTQWGPVVGADSRTRPLALHWVAHDPDATNFALRGLETARDVDAAIAVAHRAGIPAQNFLVAGADGRVAWTIAGRLPNRFGYDGRFPVLWHFGDRGWHGLVPPDDIPVLRSTSQLWTANNRIMGGQTLAVLGDGGYEQPARAAQVRDDLAGLTQAATPKDLLAIQLDDRALFLARWQKLLLNTLTPDVIAQKKSRAELRTLVENWNGRASTDAVGYRLVRSWREMVSELALGPIFAPCFDAYDGFNWQRFHYESALWTMVQEKPAHLLNPLFTRWEDLLVAAADRTVSSLDRQGTALKEATWGKRNTARIRHPLAQALPGWLTGWLNMPADPLSGDVDMPRVQGPTMGASQRLVVAPGHEADGFFSMPGGQSGHPLSPFYRAGHAPWVRGDPTPFLPGKTEHTLEFKP